MTSFYATLPGVYAYHQHQFIGFIPKIPSIRNPRGYALHSTLIRLFAPHFQRYHTLVKKHTRWRAKQLMKCTQDPSVDLWALQTLRLLRSCDLSPRQDGGGVFLFQRFVLLEHIHACEDRALTWHGLRHGLQHATSGWRPLRDARRLPGAMPPPARKVQ